MRSSGIFLAALLAAVASLARAADEPEQVYAKFHRAMLEADVKTLMRHSTAAQRARMKIDANWEEQAQKLAHLMPTAYAVNGRAAGASRVVLDLAGIGGKAMMFASGPPVRWAGKVTLLPEDGEWKVDRLEWYPGGGEPPGYTAQPVGPDAMTPRPIRQSPTRVIAVPAPAPAGAAAPAR